MILSKPKFWDKKIGFFSIILAPITLIYMLLIFFKKKISRLKTFKIPIICVGNIYIGGTGKTPTSILLAKEINKLGKKTAILRKYYKAHLDEYGLIKRYFEDLIVCKNRSTGLHKIENSAYDIVVLDDGLQDYKIKKDLNIVCFNSKQLIGNGLALPSGPLRESLNSVKKADIILINGEKNKNFENKVLEIKKDLLIFYSNYKPINLDQFRNKKLIAVAAIGNPENFFHLLKSNNLQIEKKIIYPDHYKFSRKEVESIRDEAKKKGSHIVMTEKDYFKVKEFNFDDIGYLKVLLTIDQKEKLIDRIKTLYDKNI